MNGQELIEFFKKDIYAMETTGITILEVSENYAKTKLVVQPKHLNANNVVMGGCIYTLADFTFALAANCDNNPTCTLDSHIVFNSPATGKELYAETNVIKNGRSVANLGVTITDENGRLIATCTMLGYRS